MSRAHRQHAGYVVTVGLALNNGASPHRTHAGEPGTRPIRHACERPAPAHKVGDRVYRTCGQETDRLVERGGRWMRECWACAHAIWSRV